MLRLTLFQQQRYLYALLFVEDYMKMKLLSTPRNSNTGMHVAYTNGDAEMECLQERRWSVICPKSLPLSVI